MTDRQHGNRRWSRYSADNPVRFETAGGSRNGRLSNISASGAAFELEQSDGGDVSGRLMIDCIGDYDAQIIRDLEDGFAATLVLDNEEQAALDRELSEYFHSDDEGFD